MYFYIYLLLDALRGCFVSCLLCCAPQSFYLLSCGAGLQQFGCVLGSACIYGPMDIFILQYSFSYEIKLILYMMFRYLKF